MNGSIERQSRRRHLFISHLAVGALMASQHSKSKVAEDPRSRFSAAFERVRAEILEVPVSALTFINIDVAHAVTIVLGALPAIVEHRAQIKELPGFDVKQLDKLEDYALAVLDAHSARQIDAAPDGRLPELNQEGSALRTLLYQDAQTLANRRLIDANRLAEVKLGVGYETLAVDLLSLAKLLREAWTKIAGKTAVTATELERAEAIASDIAFGIGARNTAPAALTEAGITRQKAFTLMANAYAEVRFALGYLRRKEGDLETVAPSLYANRAKARRKGDSVPPPAGEAPIAATPSPPQIVQNGEAGE
jgi:hypothetical protein